MGRSLSIMLALLVLWDIRQHLENLFPSCLATVYLRNIKTLPGRDGESRGERRALSWTCRPMTDCPYAPSSRGRTQ